MANFFGDLVCNLRNLMTQGFRSLPMILASTIFVLGLIQGNINFLFFFVGLFILTPTATYITNILFEFLFLHTFLKKHLSESFYSAAAGTSEQCDLFSVASAFGQSTGTGAGPLFVVPTYWTTIMSFFLVYLLCNAHELYIKPAAENAPKNLVSARKSQAIFSIVIVLLVTVGIAILRFGTSCESAFGMFVGSMVGGWLAYGWFLFMRKCGLGRLDDMFGISNQLLPFESTTDMEPTVCMN